MKYTLQRCQQYFMAKLNTRNWSLQPFSLDYYPASFTIYLVCVHFIHEWRDLQFKVDSERQIIWETLHDNSIYSQSFCQKSAEGKWPKKYFFIFWFDIGLGVWTVASSLISQHTTYYWENFTKQVNNLAFKL